MRTLLFILFLFLCTGSPAQNVQFGSESESDSYRNIPFFLGKMDGKIYTIRITGYAASVYTQLMKSDGKAAASAMILGVSKFSDEPSKGSISVKAVACISKFTTRSSSSYPLTK
jgi:hypothetical protein